MWIQHLIIVCIVDDAIAFSHYNARTMHTHTVSPSLILTLSLFKSSIDIFFLKSYLMNWTCLYFYPNHVITFFFKPKINFMIFKLSANQSKKKQKKTFCAFNYIKLISMAEAELKSPGCNNVSVEFRCVVLFSQKLFVFVY